MKSFFGLVGSLLSVFWVLFVLITPLLGVWLGSSLVSYYGGPAELAVAAGVLLFPVLPVLWDARSTVKWREKQAKTKLIAGKPKQRSMKAFDRIVVRTLVINLLLMIGLVVWFPKVAFSALATRGDWFLPDRQDETTQTFRGALFASAAGLEWLHQLANPNPYKKEGDDVPVPESVKPVEVVTPTPPIRRWKKDPIKPEDPVIPVEPIVPEPVAPAEPTWAVGATTWPRPPDVHTVVAAMTAAEESSLEAVARHIAAREPDPFLRVKALHDWVVTRLHYDHDSLQPGQRKPQDAQSVFANRTGVCEGYARLMVALGKVTGDQIVYVVGDVREDTGEAAPVGHAWNTVEIKGSWYVIDATWDDPAMNGSKEDVYSTDYLFIPPTIAIFSHRPDDDKWQLLSKPLSRGDFLRQPFARPGLARVGLELVSPDRTRVEVTDGLEMKISNPRRLFVMAHVGDRDSGKTERCGVDNAEALTLKCPVGPSGRYRALLFTNSQLSGKYRHAATLDVIKH
jgi:transglutaminase-like putative cysteine protease